ncbi:MAG TPA: SGNH/GDSL hydrolase family protein [Planctomycetota bacterium]|nr:SGNH/GDSL hydrolase family protein [Planctomycetota bacterium]HRR80759.1 SGNH/GDSL hydrolase family protein [Planctomycetota bacterium]HRT94398.1 SGNH/GDSL hydrolase family protein [Planctomycetota bacterium]
MNSSFALTVALAVVVLAADASAGARPTPPQGAPEYQAPPRPTDGANMALTIEKLEKGFDPERPLLIWAIGSSFTNGLGDGSTLIELLKPRFPNMPKVVYKRFAGNSTPYHLTRGWARHLVIPEQPDVVILYNFGKVDDLEQLIVDLRQGTTADILVGTIHWCLPHEKQWPDPDLPCSHQDIPKLRAVCEKHGVELVESRREMTEYMLAHKLGIKDLLADAVHENAYASLMTNMNIARHFNRPAKFAYDPRTRERRLDAAASPDVKLAGAWEKGDGSVTAKEKGAAIEVSFTGSRIDLIGWRSPDGGRAEVWLDGKPAAEVPVFQASYIQPDAKNAPLPPNPPRDRSPHRLTLGSNVVPQSWTLTMTNDAGDYELVGSLTGSDGTGNNRKPFTSKSGQIILEPEFWRQPESNKAGDKWTFDVTRPTVGRVEFKGDKARFRLTLAQALPNAPHSIKLVADGTGPVAIAAFDVFEPPMK